MRRVLHIVRADPPPAATVDLLHDWLVDGRGGGWLLEGRGARPPDPMHPGPIDDAQLFDLICAADLVCVW